MTKNRSMKIAVLVLALALLTSCFVGSTFARYTSTGTGSATVNVATWDVSVKSGVGSATVTELTGTTSATGIVFDLFTTREEIGGGAENEVKEGVIAPGTQGSFTFTLNNNSEVAVNYTITLDLSGFGDLPIEFKVDGAWKQANAFDDDKLVITGTMLVEGGEVVTTPVEWQWAYGDAGADNQFAGDDCEVPVTIVVDQAA